MKRAFLISLLLYASMLMAAAQDFILTPQWTPQSQFAGYYAAYEKGFYKEAGIDVELNETKGTMHGFDIVQKAPTTKAAVAARVDYMRRMF